MPVLCCPIPGARNDSAQRRVVSRLACVGVSGPTGWTEELPCIAAAYGRGNVGRECDAVVNNAKAKSGISGLDEVLSGGLSRGIRKPSQERSFADECRIADLRKLIICKEKPMP
jgi:hypothetical protein